MRWLALCLSCLSAMAMAQPFGARVVEVIDGDTLVVLQGHRKSTVRLADIDAPEQAQAHGGASRIALVALALHKEVLVTPRTIDDYGRVVAVVQVGDINLNETLLLRGLAWEYSQFHANRRLKAMEAEARRARRGLWAQAQPQPPWEFRKSHAPNRERQALNTACGNKRHCSQMTSCEEAKFYLVQCRVRTLDKDGDGVPCENLCSLRPR